MDAALEDAFDLVAPCGRHAPPLAARAEHRCAREARSSVIRRAVGPGTTFVGVGAGAETRRR